MHKLSSLAHSLFFFNCLHSWHKRAHCSKELNTKRDLLDSQRLSKGMLVEYISKIEKSVLNWSNEFVYLYSLLFFFLLFLDLFLAFTLVLLSFLFLCWLLGVITNLVLFLFSVLFKFAFLFRLLSVILFWFFGGNFFTHFLVKSFSFFLQIFGFHEISSDPNLPLFCEQSCVSSSTSHSNDVIILKFRRWERNSSRVGYHVARDSKLAIKVSAPAPQDDLRPGCFHQLWDFLFNLLFLDELFKTKGIFQPLVISLCELFTNYLLILHYSGLILISLLIQPIHQSVISPCVNWRYFFLLKGNTV